MKITHNNKTYIDAATHAGLRCWLDTKEVDAIESLRVEYPHGYRPLNVGDWAKDELIRYAVDPDSWRQPADAILVTDAEDHRKHWPLRNTHRHPLEDVGERREAIADKYNSREFKREILGTPGLPAPQPVDGGEWLKIHDTLIQYSNRSPVRWYSSDQSSGTDCWPWHFNINQGATPITPTQAAEWLRQNGHEAEAAKLEGDRFEPVGTVPVVGDVLRHGDTDFKVREIDLADRHYYECRSTAGFHRLSFRGFQDAGWRILNRRTGGNSKPANPV